jgi:hypothetical protein
MANFFERLRNGWNLALTSLDILQENKSLLLFPVLSSISLLLIFFSFAGGLFALETQFHFLEVLKNSGTETGNEILLYALVFVFYFINYTVIVFFNMALVHCTRIYLEGGQPTVSDGISFSNSRISTIIKWSLLSATVGVVLKVIEDKSEKLGAFIASLVGMLWAILTFFVVPVLAYENVGPIDAVKRSGAIMREKWGEALGANFGFGFIKLIIFVLCLVGGVITAYLVHPLAGIALGLIVFLGASIAISAAEVVFVAAAYQYTQNKPTGSFDTKVLDNLFAPK